MSSDAGHEADPAPSGAEVGTTADDTAGRHFRRHFPSSGAPVIEYPDPCAREVACAVRHIDADITRHRAAAESQRIAHRFGAGWL